MCSTINSFIHLSKQRLREFPGSNIVPSMMNSDVIENFFSSQRGRCGGDNTNPTVLAYSKNINTIIMTSERCRSKKRNAASDAGVGGAYPYKILAKTTFRAAANQSAL